MDEMEQIKVLPRIDDRLPNWSPQDLVGRDCPFCSFNGAARYIRPDGLNVHECEQCGSFYVSPTPSSEALSHFYSAYTQEHRTHISLDKRNPFVKTARAHLRSIGRSDFRVAEISSIVKIHGKAVLDIGCGTGSDLIKFKDMGATVEGIDLDQAAITFARDELGLENTKNCSIQDFNPEITYDIILMMDLIEHVVDPLALLKKAKNYLNDKGVIAIWTPNASFIKRFADTTLLQVDLEHINYLTFETCDYLAHALALKLIHLESVGFANIRTHKENTSKRDAVLSQLQSRCSNLLNRQDVRLGTYHLFCLFTN
jgi:2-polyprenyl-3-methyl-5-hydroxy-6-metoxy-1,4-benzoquinol methylase